MVCGYPYIKTAINQEVLKMQLLKNSKENYAIIKESDLKIIDKVLNTFTPYGIEYDDLNNEQQDLLVDCDIIMMKLWKQIKEDKNQEVN